MLSNCKESDSLSTTVSTPTIVFATEEVIFTEWWTISDYKIYEKYQQAFKSIYPLQHCMINI